MSQFPFGFTGGDDDKPGQDPLAALFSMLSGAGGPGSAGAAGELPFPLLAELQRMLSSGDGPVNWELAGQLARQTAADGDSSLTAAQRGEIADAVRLAGHWLDEVTSFPSPSGEAVAWSRADWVAGTLPAWQRLCDPVASRVVAALGQAIPAEAATEAGPLMGMMRQIGGVVFGMQLGQALGTLAREVVGSTDVGLPLGPPAGAMLPAGVAAFGEGLDVPADEVRLYLALREAAHQRLFAAAPWLGAHLFDSVDAYARGIEIDGSALTDLVQGIDPMNFDPTSLQDKLGENGLFQPRTTESQQAALDRLETALALVEGWVDEVVHAAAVDKLPHAVALRETTRRRRATGGPAEQTFATLVGLELRPRRLREAAALWSAVLADRGTDGREAVWRHPDLMPGSGDLDDPAAFLGRREGTEDDLDAELRRLTEGEGPAPE